MKKLLVLSVTIFSILSLSAQSVVDNTFFDRVDVFLKKHVAQNSVDYAAAKADPELKGLVSYLGTASVEGLDVKTTQAFYINAYNLLVIEGVTKVHPINSVLDVGGFFDTKKHLVVGKKITLNQLEKDLLLKQFKDARFHFVLVCGAVGCPPITNFAYRPAKLEAQLQQQTKKALNDASFVKVNEQKQEAQLSQIFEWYAKDFGGSKAQSIAFINKYRDKPIPSSFKVGFYTYDWSLNEIIQGQGAIDAPASLGNNASRYVVSAAIPKGSTETKIFNNLYTQSTTSDGMGERVSRSTFFTTNLSFLYGLTSRFNLGIDARYRRVRNDVLPSSPLEVFKSGEESSNRQGLTTFGPKIRWAPTEKLPNFSIQSTFSFPIGQELEGNNLRPFIDWNGATWWTQFFNDISLGSNFSVFTEIDLLIEDIGNPANNAANRFSTPATVILSYFPNPKTTVYALSSYSPFWQSEFDYFAQLGIGTKYQITPNFELELLYTNFTNKFLEQNNGLANTFNFGIRINR